MHILRPRQGRSCQLYGLAQLAFDTDLQPGGRFRGTMVFVRLGTSRSRAAEPSYVVGANTVTN